MDRWLLHHNSGSTALLPLRAEQRMRSRVYMRATSILLAVASAAAAVVSAAATPAAVAVFGRLELLVHEASQGQIFIFIVLVVLSPTSDMFACGGQLPFFSCCRCSKTTIERRLQQPLALLLP